MADNKDQYVSVAVVGAGLAGLYAARCLSKQFPDVIVLEAQDRIGGRVRQIHGLAPWPVEAGAEFVHGSQSKFSEVVKDFGLEFVEKDWPDYWFFGKEKLLTSDEGVDDEVDKVHEMFDSVGDLAQPEQDMSAADWLRSKGATEKQIAVADVCYANDFGCSIQQLGLKEMIVENQRWDSGETYLIMQQPMSAVVDRLSQGLRIRTSWPVTSISYDAGGAVLTGPGGSTLAARKVVITAPLKVLQAGSIQFQPPLPPAKQGALQRLRMGNAVKILVSFKQRFWPEDLYDVVCTDCYVPEFWMTQRHVTDASCKGLYAVTGFVAGERADALRDVPAAEAVARFLAQLDTIFGSPSQPKPATASYVRSLVFDWSKEPWVGGAYTYPTLGAQLGDRAALGAPLLGTLFFAGEACHTGVNPCMQAALETGEQAAQQVAAALQPVPSRL